MVAFIRRAIFILTLLPTFSPQFLAQSPKIVWKTDLSVDKDFHKRLEIEEVSLGVPSIHFLDAAHLLVSFDDGPYLGANPNFVVHTFHALSFMVQDGSLSQKLDYEAKDDHALALPVQDGFVILAGEAITKYSVDFTKGMTFPTPIAFHNKRPDGWLLDVAPGGETLVLYGHHAQDISATWKWLRASDLAVVTQSTGPLASELQATASAVVLRTGSDMDLFHGSQSEELCKRCNAFVLSDELILIDKFRIEKFPPVGEKYALQTFGGETIRSLSIDTGAFRFARSSDSTRLAYISGHLTGGKGFLIRSGFTGLSGRVVVLDWLRNKRVAEINIEEQLTNPSALLSQSSLALSADGKYLAVLFHHSLTLYELP